MRWLYVGLAIASVAGAVVLVYWRQGWYLRVLIGMRVPIVLGMCDDMRDLVSDLRFEHEVRQVNQREPACPTTAEIQTLFSRRSQDVRDYWGRDYELSCFPTYTATSYGPDGVSGTSDDLEWPSCESDRR